jgi:hypothetical protein
MVEPTDVRYRPDLAVTLDLPTLGRIHLERLVRSVSEVVGEVSAKNPLEVALAEDNRVVEILQINRSTYGFCQGLPGPDCSSSIPRTFACLENASPWILSRSRSKKSGASRHANASRSCRPVHSAVGFVVTLKWTTRRRWLESTKNTYGTWFPTVGTMKKSDRDHVPEIELPAI